MSTSAHGTCYCKFPSLDFAQLSLQPRVDKCNHKLDYMFLTALHCTKHTMNLQEMCGSLHRYQVQSEIHQTPEYTFTCNITLSSLFTKYVNKHVLYMAHDTFIHSSHLPSIPTYFRSSATLIIHVTSTLSLAPNSTLVNLSFVTSHAINFMSQTLYSS